MKYFGGELGALHKELSAVIRKKGKFGEAKELFFQIHSQLHSAEVYGTGETEFDRLICGINEEKCSYALWDIWHIARIEDITAGILLGGKNQLFSAETARAVGSPVSDTGNAMTDSEIKELIESISLTELLKYRSSVGRRTREIVSAMTEADAKRKFPAEYRDKLFDCGGLTSHPDSAWLADYWLSKDCAGIILMPLTRHQIMHLNQCGQLFSKIR